MKTQIRQRYTDSQGIQRKVTLRQGNRQRVRLFAGSALALCLLWSPGFAQSNRVVHVGVSIMENSAVGVSSVAARDRLVKTLNHQKDKKTQVSLEGFAIAAGTDQIMNEAKLKNCDFVVETTLTESHNQGNLSSMNDVFSGTSTNVPEYSAIIEYKLIRVSDGSTVSSGTAKATDVGSQAEVVLQALDHLAGKVLADVKKSGA